MPKIVLDVLEVTEKDTVHMLKLISWNVHRGFKKLSKQVEALGDQAPHIVALQEVTAHSALLFECAGEIDQKNQFAPCCVSVSQAAFRTNGKRPTSSCQKFSV